MGTVNGFTEIQSASKYRRARLGERHQVVKETLSIWYGCITLIQQEGHSYHHLQYVQP